MALGGGTFLVQNKVLPGAYINFISVAQASATLSDRGIVSIPLAMNWGPEGKIFTVEQADFIKNSQKIFGYAYTADELKPMREIFLHAKTVHFFRLGTSGVKAANTYATAKYPGTRGNDLRTVITANENTTEQKPLFDVATFLGTVQVDLQEGVAAITDLKANAYVDWKSSGTLSLTASLPLTGGTNGTVADSDYQTYLDQAEAYTFNAMGCTESKATITALFAAFAKRMRDDVGKKFQVVLFRKLADYEGVVSVKNGLTSDKTSTALIPWVTGVIGGTAVNKSATNMTYDGEYDVDTDFTQTQLENGIKEGSFMFHRVDEAVCVLTDINSFISITDEKSSDFSSNQTIRVLDQIANDIAVLFGKKYLGKVPNDAAGRISLWNDMSTFDTFQDGWAADAFASGAAWGDGVADKVSGMFDFSALDSMGADSLDAFNLGNDLDSIYGNTGDIANNTAATADALDIAEEDLAYLRDIAEREAINRFTTAEIKVEQHNENHISKDADLDGIMDAWANDFAEKLEVSEEGVHE